MSDRLPRLRLNLDFLPSPLEDRPGLLIRDGHGYSDAVLIIPPPLVACLELFDGERTELDLRSELVRITGEIDTTDLQEHLVGTLSAAGFLHDEVYSELKSTREREFAESAVREPVHAGSGYPDEADELRATLGGYLSGDAAAEERNLVGIAAPHVSPFGGVESYRAAYRALAPEHRDRTFVILGTSHYGQPERFGLTRKPFLTPFGQTRTDDKIVNRLMRQRAALEEDYCHAVEHSIEFQVIFLQHLFGPDIKVVPLLCGPFATSIMNAHLPEANDHVAAFFGELGEIAAGRKDLLWVMGIDMAHMGRRYGDPFAATANRGTMAEVAERDRHRIDRVLSSDAEGFWHLVRENHDDLKWCGSAPLYTFLKAVPSARGTLRHYQHWNIDDASVVSFGALAFREKEEVEGVEGVEEVEEVEEVRRSRARIS